MSGGLTKKFGNSTPMRISCASEALERSSSGESLAVVPYLAITFTI